MEKQESLYRARWSMVLHPSGVKGLLNRKVVHGRLKSAPTPYKAGVVHGH